MPELVARYEFEPTLADVYVEGTRDQSLFAWFLKANAKNDIRVYTIDSIDIPNHILQERSLNKRSNRSRLVALAMFLDENLSHDKRVLCVIDRDFEDAKPTLPTNSFLQMTDCNSLECYAFNKVSLSKFCLVALGDTQQKLSTILPSIITVLQKLYAIRLANEILDWGMKMIQFHKYVKVTISNVSLDSQTLIQAYLQSNNRWHERDVFFQSVEEAEAMRPPDFLKSIRGHDISELLQHVIRKINPERLYGNPETISGVLLATMDINEYKKTTLFNRILLL